MIAGVSTMPSVSTPIKRVLVVDDDAPIRQLVGTVLRREGYAVDLAHDGQEAIARAFATKAPPAEKWEGVAWSERAGVPAIDGALVQVACELRDVIAGGDHVIVTGEVTDLETSPGTPLLFHRGAYRPLH